MVILFTYLEAKGVPKLNDHGSDANSCTVTQLKMNQKVILLLRLLKSENVCVLDMHIAFAAGIFLLDL